MRRLALVPLLLFALVLPFQASAVGLGSIETRSALNQRLDAEIPLRGVSPDNADRVSVALASERAFREVGLSRPAILSQLRFEVVERDGDLFVRATSVERISEPFLSFLIEVDAPSGNLLREYTILLDPPVYAADEPDVADDPAPEPERTDPEPTVEAEPTVEPEEVAAAEEPTAEEERRRRDRFGDEPVFMEVERERDRITAERRAEAERRAAEEAAAAERARAEAREPTMPDTYETRAGDTAWEVASRMAAGEVSTQQMMLALLRNNPDAFMDDNVNRLREGYVLRTPSRDEAASINAQQAIAQIDRQNTLWREWRDGMRASAAPAEEGEEPVAAADAPETEAESAEALQIVGAPDGGDVAADDDTAAGTAEQQEELQLAREQLESARLEKAELESRVGELESMVERMDRLITQRNEELASLQQRLVELAEEEGVALDPDTLPDEEAVPEEVAEAIDEDDEPVTVTIDIDTLDTTMDRLAEVAAQREETLIARAEEAAEADEPEREEDDDAAAVAEGDGAQHDTGVETIRTQPGDEGLLSRLMGPLAGVAAVASAAAASLPGGNLGLAGLALVVLALIALLVMRRRQQASEEAVDVGDVEFADEDDDAFADLIDEEPESDMDSGTDEFDQTTRMSAADVSGLMDDDAPSSNDSDVMTDEDPLAALDDDMDAGADESDKDDTIAEVDVYLAYGLHQQARDLLTLALQESPDRADYHEKLLETLYSGGEKEEFEKQAARFHGKVDGSSKGLWKRVVAMGREIAPGNELFRDAEDPGITADEIRQQRPDTADIDLGDDDQHGDVDLDFSLDDEDDETDTSGSAGDDFDQTVMTPASPEATQERDLTDAADGDDELEFDLGDLDDLSDGEPESDDADRSHAATATSAGSVDSADTEGPVEGDDQDLEFDLSDLESNAGDDFGLTADEEKAASASPEATHDGDDELDFDIGDLDLGEEPSAAEPDQEHAVAAGSDDTDEFDVSGLDPEATRIADSDEDVSIPTGSDVEEPQAGASDDDADIEFDLSELDDLGGDEQSAAGAPEPQSATGVSSAAESDDDGGEPDEFDTMLDLARAYIDMGDQDSATSALEEVVASGNDEQRAEAKKLLDTAN